MVYQGPTFEPALPPAVAGPAFLPDGTEVWVRPLQASDRELVREFVERETPESIELRYFSALRPVLAQEESVPRLSPEEGLCLLVLGEHPDRIAVLGVGEYSRSRAGSTVADVGFVVAGAFRGRGIATLLLARLARAARAFGIARFEARVRPENPEMLEVFRDSGVPVHPETVDGEVEVQIPLGPEVISSASATAGPGTQEADRAPGAVPEGDGRASGTHPRPSGLRSRT